MGLRETMAAIAAKGKGRVDLYGRGGRIYLLYQAGF